MNTISKKTIVVLLGGQSSEHEISLLSARNIIAAMSREKYRVIPIGIDKQGRWWMQDQENLLENEDDPKTVKLVKSDKAISIELGKKGYSLQVKGAELGPVDCIFPTLHGPKGEDGSLQGLLKLIDLPFVGCDVLASAACMDKDICKRLLTQAGIANTKYLLARRDGIDLDFQTASAILGTPIFVKPANQGSSVGVFKVNNQTEFENALKQAFQYDNKLVVEEAIEGREIECAVLGGSHPVASLPGEVILSDGFYSYDTKYISGDGAKLQIPAELDEKTLSKLQGVALEAYQALECCGLARVDFFLDKQNNVFVNEVNTLPGFTKISMYPAMWEASGISYAELVDQLIELAVCRFEMLDRLKIVVG